MKTMTTREAIEYIKANVEKLDYNKNECFAVRGDDYIPKKRFRRSMNNPDDGFTKPHQLPGVCACFVAENDPFGDYDELNELPDTSGYGAHKFLLVGEKVDIPTNDEWNNEVVLANHRIIARIVD